MSIIVVLTRSFAIKSGECSLSMSFTKNIDVGTNKIGLEAQSYEANCESIRSASCVLSKQPQVNASKLIFNLKNHEDSS
ncbi:hypothetical protein GLOIN_2v1736641 [Rhizophagus clarus]|uniref:Uncharacterized protein n=1 Tax=Rhizophagus clarus TaxID=94130 RepID=A0A8H3MAL8_9GLOM|nr:hypothetical protein GLOIN_2v1736641 [Rhizophagus clarus]